MHYKGGFDLCMHTLWKRSIVHCPNTYQTKISSTPSPFSNTHPESLHSFYSCDTHYTVPRRLNLQNLHCPTSFPVCLCCWQLTLWPLAVSVTTVTTPGQQHMHPRPPHAAASMPGHGCRTHNTSLVLVVILTSYIGKDHHHHHHHHHQSTGLLWVST